MSNIIDLRGRTTVVQVQLHLLLVRREGGGGGGGKEEEKGSVGELLEALDLRRLRMPWTRFSGSLESPKVDVFIDMGHPFLNRSLDGFLKIGTVGATKVLAEETYHCLHKGNISKKVAEETFKKMCKEGACWGAVAGLYVGTQYAIDQIRGSRDWKNAMIGGAVTGALVSAVNHKSRDQVILDAITGGAIATAAECINHLT